MTWIRNQRHTVLINSAQVTQIYIEGSSGSATGPAIWNLVADLSGTSGCDGEFSPPKAILGSFGDIDVAQDVLNDMFGCLHRNAPGITIMPDPTTENTTP